MKLILAFAILLITSAAYAQTAIVVDINRARLTWDWTQGPEPNNGLVEAFNVKCGPSSKTYNRTTTFTDPALRSVPILSVIAGSGTYYCVASASNQYGESGNSNEVFFDAGAAPFPPSNFAVTAQ